MTNYLILFDIDGTLLKSHGATREAKKRAVWDVFKIEIDFSEYHFGGQTDWQTLVDVLAPHGVGAITIGRKMPAFEGVFAGHLNALIGNYRVESLPGTHELIAYLLRRDNVFLGLVTGNTSQTARVKLRAAGFDPDIFVAGAYGNESDDRNTLPQLAIERARAITHRAIESQYVYVIGDTVADIACARAAEAVAVAVATGFADREALIAARPDFLLEDLTEFREQVGL